MHVITERIAIYIYHCKLYSVHIKLKQVSGYISPDILATSFVQIKECPYSCIAILSARMHNLAVPALGGRGQYSQKIPPLGGPRVVLLPSILRQWFQKINTLCNNRPTNYQSI